MLLKHLQQFLFTPIITGASSQTPEHGRLTISCISELRTTVTEDRESAYKWEWSSCEHLSNALFKCTPAIKGSQDQDLCRGLYTRTEPPLYCIRIFKSGCDAWNWLPLIYVFQEERSYNPSPKSTHYTHYEHLWGLAVLWLQAGPKAGLCDVVEDWLW